MFRIMSFFGLSGMSDENLEQFPVRFEPQQLRRLEKLAKQYDRKVAYLVRKCVEWGLPRLESEQPNKTAKDRP